MLKALNDFSNETGVDIKEVLIAKKNFFMDHNVTNYDIDDYRRGQYDAFTNNENLEIINPGILFDIDNLIYYYFMPNDESSGLEDNIGKINEHIY